MGRRERLFLGAAVVHHGLEAGRVKHRHGLFAADQGGAGLRGLVDAIVGREGSPTWTLSVVRACDEVSWLLMLGWRLAQSRTSTKG